MAREFDKKDGYYTPNSSITYEGVRYFTDSDGYKDGIDIDYYVANPSFDSFMKETKTDSFSSVNDVQNLIKFIENGGVSNDDTGSKDGNRNGGGKGEKPKTFKNLNKLIIKDTKNPNLNIPDADYEFVSNPRNPSVQDLRYFAQEYLVPVYTGKKDKVKLGDGSTGEVDEVRYEYRDTLPPKKFRYKGRLFKPREMFLNQNEDLQKTTGIYRPKKVKKFFDKATKMPELSFSTTPVELIKPSYGDVKPTFM